MGTPVPPENATILLVDDSTQDQRDVATLLQAHGEWRIAFVGNGPDALKAIASNPPSVVLANMQLPQSGGLELVEEIRERFPQVPVVLLTSEGNERIAMDALKAGAADYVPRQSLVHELVPVLERVLSMRQVQYRRFRVLAGMTRRSSQFILENDPCLVPPLVAMLRDDLISIGLCDMTGATRAGIAIEEALLNAVYHGNLEVSSDLRASGDEAFHALATERRQQEPYMLRRVTVTARMSPTWAAFVIADQGPGFDVAGLPDPTEPSNIARPSGRGVLLMRTFMDKVRYNSTGNRVTLIKTRDRV
jgi:CheY-like chemotaxis protein/anti-sigma regulatory factor (Ser/Thr protein kinase)